MRILQDMTNGHYPLLVSVVEGIEYPGLTALTNALYAKPDGLGIYYPKGKNPHNAKAWERKEGPEPRVVRPSLTFMKGVICTGTGKEICLNIPVDLCAWDNERVLLEQCMHAIASFEVHEAHEQFKYKGLRIFDPHAVSGLGPLTYSALTHYRKLGVPDMTIPIKYGQLFRRRDET